MDVPITARAANAAAGAVEWLRLRPIVVSMVRRLPSPLRLELARLQVRLDYMDGLVMVPPDSLRRSFGRALELLGRGPGAGPGTYLDFGVYIGTSMACMYRAALEVGDDALRMIGFDSFRGLPPGSEREGDGRWRGGAFRSDVGLTRRNLRRLGIPEDRLEFVAGWFADTLVPETRERLGIDRADVVMIDTGLSSATACALEFCSPLIVDRAVFFLEDYGTIEGDRIAFDDWLARHPELSASVATDLCYRPKVRAFLVTRSDVPLA